MADRCVICGRPTDCRYFHTTDVEGITKHIRTPICEDCIIYYMPKNVLGVSKERIEEISEKYQENQCLHYTKR